MRQFGSRSAIVEIAARLEIQPEVKTSAASLPWKIGELALELDDRVARAGNIAGAARAGADLRRRLDHGGDHLGVLAHAEIIVRAPNGDVLYGAVVAMPAGARKGSPRRVRDGRRPDIDVRPSDGRRPPRNIADRPLRQPSVWTSRAGRPIGRLTRRSLHDRWRPPQSRLVLLRAVALNRGPETRAAAEASRHGAARI